MAPQYGEVRVDYITYTTGVVPNEGNATAYVSGLINSPTFSGNVIIEGNTTIDGNLNVSGDINASGVVISGITGLFDDGTETAPSIAFASDPDTGIYKPATNEIGFSTNGGESLRIDDIGRVGIGTTDPQAKLDVRGTSDSPSLTFNGSGQAIVGDSASQLAIGRDSSTPFSLYLQARASNNAARNILLAPVGGNVGIGTSSPSAQLTIEGSQNADPTSAKDPISDIYIQNLGGTEGLNNYGGSIGFSRINKTRRGAMIAEVQSSSNIAQGGLAFFTKPSTVDSTDVVVEQVRIDHNGNVGIGTTDPQAKLDVNGDIILSSLNKYVSFAAGNTQQSGLLAVAGSPSVNRAGINFQGVANSQFTEIAFSTSNSVNTMAERMRIDRLGNVGIGTTNPQAKLEIKGGSNSTTDYSLTLTNSAVNYGMEFGAYGASNRTFGADTIDYKIEVGGDLLLAPVGNVGIGTDSPQRVLHIERTGSASNCEIRLDNPSGEGRNISLTGAGSQTRIIQATGKSDGNALAFYTGAREDVRFDVNGNVGIGTDNPQVKLHVEGNNTTAKLWLASTSSGRNSFDPDEASIDLTAFGMNTTSKYTPSINFGSTDSSFTTTNPKFGAAINAEAAQSYTSDTQGGMKLNFWTSPSSPGTGHGLVQRMTISNTGNVGIGTSSPLTPLHVNSATATSTIIESANTQSLIQFKSTDTNLFYMGTTGDNWNVQTNGVQRLAVTESGNVGIGTTAPKVKLDVNGSIIGGRSLTQYISLTGDSSGNKITAVSEPGNSKPFVIQADSESTNIQIRTNAATNNGIYLQPGGSSKLVVLADGNVGINTTNPQAQLDVNGTIKATSIEFPGSSSELDDYEEGDFTPTFGGSVTNPAGTYNTNSGGTYRKIGNTVFVQLRMRFDCTSIGAGNLLIRGMPFTAINTLSRGCVSMGSLTNFNTSSTNGPPRSGILTNNTTIITMTSLDLSTGLTKTCGTDALKLNGGGGTTTGSNNIEMNITYMTS